ncbi:MAG TPA: adenylate/guanylate cyclase domain-containing protein [Baekduia sp.]|nr:adenylate/guanylate cyclase domain-containing protein [Baekduia sp.]
MSSAARPGPETTLTSTFVFADIAGFTALTEAHGDLEAADLVARFSTAVREELPSCGGVHIKTIGDALMLHIPDPGAAVLFGLRITHELMRRHGSPAIRVGLHHGPAVERDGDFFGATVNLAARVSSAAVGGEVLVTGDTAALVPDLEGVIFESRGRQELRNVSRPVELFAAVRLGEDGGAALATDPVCRMAVDPAEAPARVTYDGEAYFFCSLTCVGAFARRPERFTGGA